MKDFIKESICVDAACSGNPGPLEYKGIDTKTGELIFHHSLPYGTNNIGEFLAVVHALALLKKEGKNIPVYTDSQTALAWIKKKKCNTQTFLSDIKSLGIIKRAEEWLKNNTYENEVLKWETKIWGEIKADFGRK